MRKPRDRAAVAFVLSAVLAYLLLTYLRSEELTIESRMLALRFLYPGYLLRGLGSGSEMGFGDERDTVLLLGGSAGTVTLIFAIADAVVRKLWHRGRAATR